MLFNVLVAGATKFLGVKLPSSGVIVGEIGELVGEGLRIGRPSSSSSENAELVFMSENLNLFDK